MNVACGQCPATKAHGGSQEAIKRVRVIGYFNYIDDVIDLVAFEVVVVWICGVDRARRVARHRRNGEPHAECGEPHRPDILHTEGELEHDNGVGSAGVS